MKTEIAMLISLVWHRRFAEKNLVEIDGKQGFLTKVLLNAACANQNA